MRKEPEALPEKPEKSWRRDNHCKRHWRHVLGYFLGIPFVAYGGLCIAGLGVVSVFWR